MTSKAETKNMSSGSDLYLTEKEREAIEKKRQTRAQNLEKARQKRQENKDKIKQLEQIEYANKREDFAKTIDSVVKSKPVEKKQPATIPEGAESEEEEEYIIYNNKKKKDKAETEALKKEIAEMKKEVDMLKVKPKDIVELIQEPQTINPVNPASQPAQAQPQQTKVVVVKPPGLEFTNHLRQKILNF